MNQNLTLTYENSSTILSHVVVSHLFVNVIRLHIFRLDLARGFIDYTHFGTNDPGFNNFDQYVLVKLMFYHLLITFCVSCDHSPAPIPLI